MPDGRSEHDRITDLAIQLERYAHVTNTELRALKQGQERLEDGQKRLEEGQRELRADVTELRVDVNELREGQKELRTEVADIREGQKQLVDVMNENFRHLFLLLKDRNP